MSIRIVFTYGRHLNGGVFSKEVKMPSNVALVLTIIAGGVSILLWFLNPNAVKKRKLAKLNERLNKVKDEREKARQAGNNALYMQKEAEYNEILKEISIVSGN